MLMISGISLVLWVEKHVLLIDTLCAVVCFDSAASIDAVMGTTSVLKSANLHWFYMDSTKYIKCGNLGHTFLNCFVGGKTSPGRPTRRILSNNNKSRLASIYVRRSAPIFCPVSFGGASWANIVGESLFPPLPICNGSASFGSSSEMKPTPMVSMKLNNRFAALEHSLVSLAECVDKLAKRLDSLGPTVSQSSPGCQLLVTPSLQNQGMDIVISKGSGVTTSGETIAGTAVLGSSVISKMEKTLNNLSIMVMSLLTKIDNANLVWKIATCNVRGVNVPAKQKDVVCWHVDSGNMVSIITEMKLRSNISKHSLIKASTWSNSQGFVKVIDYIFISKNLSSALAGHKPIDEIPVEELTFTAKVTTHNLVSFQMSNSWERVDIYYNVTIQSNWHGIGYSTPKLIDLGGLLDAQLNDKHKQANRDKWKFNIKDADTSKWTHFREHLLDKFLEYIDEFNAAKDTKNLDTM
ncbi:hypothetical protein G9A89_022183 [Geosiphon pyriformis]|nr:hypothetical protein G9A89_022183 [Geosiphon pyriformis]